MFLSIRKYDLGCSSLIPDPDPDFLPIPNPGSRFKIHRILDPDPQHWRIYKFLGLQVPIRNFMYRYFYWQAKKHPDLVYGSKDTAKNVSNPEHRCQLFYFDCEFKLFVIFIIIWWLSVLIPKKIKDANIIFRLTSGESTALREALLWNLSS